MSRASHTAASCRSPTRRIATGSESRYGQLLRRVITAVALAMACNHLWVAFVGPRNALVLRSVYVGFALTLAFLTVPASRKGSASARGLGISV